MRRLSLAAASLSILACLGADVQTESPSNAVQTVASSNAVQAAASSNDVKAVASSNDVRTAFGHSHWNGGRTVPVHRLAPLDFDGDKVSPGASLPSPISQDKTCGQCHDVQSARGGSHFRTGLDTNDAPSSVQVEPWFWADEALGLAVPLSLHGQPGAFAPREIGLSAFEWTKMFGRSFPGGGIGCDKRAMEEVAGPRQRWFVTGPLEANCLACHQQGDAYDSSEWARQVLRENFTGAAIAASGLGAVDGMNERLDSAWAAAENPDDHLFKVPQKVAYDLTQFDQKQRCVFAVGKPQDARCLACHAVSENGMPSHAIMGDVHLKRGMKCVDCHKNGMDHRIKTTSCRECHVDPKGAGPHPHHAGIPLVHFEKLACTVCHSGVTKDGARAQVRTARANRIGIYGRVQWATDCPYIVEPVFMKGQDGKIAPHRVMWPSYFAQVTTNGTVTPLRLDAIKELKVFKNLNATKDIKDAKDLKDLNLAKPLTKALAAAALTELKTATPAAEFAFIGHGKLWMTEGSNLVASTFVTVEPVAWPVGHDVRPARMARGANPVKCADCHTGDSDFFQAKIAPTGPLADADVEPVSQADLMGVGAGYHALLGTTFAMRPMLKIFMWTVFGFICLFVMAAAAVALNKVAGLISDSTDDFIWGVAKWIVDMGFVVCLLYLAASGVIGWMVGGMSGIWLVFHMCAGGGFAACVLLMLFFRLKERTLKALPGLAWLLWTAFAAGVVFTAVMPMMTVYGGHGQEMLLWSHRCISLCFFALSCLVCWLCCRKR